MPSTEAAAPGTALSSTMLPRPLLTSFGMGDYRFMLWAGDGAPDTFRIRNWEEDEFGVETDVCDNDVDQPTGGGSIVVHAK